MKSRLQNQRIMAPAFGVASGVVTSAQAAQEKNPERNAHFGETDLNTSFSTDAFIWQDRITTTNGELK